MSSRVRSIFDPQDPCSPLSTPNSQTALLLLDYQNLSVAAIGAAAPDILSTARTVQKWAAENDVLVIHCLVDTKSAPRPEMKMAGRFRLLQEKLKESPALGDEAAALTPISTTEKVDARRAGFISALQGPKLREMLDAANIKSLILGGLSTSGCVLSTCRAATDAEYIVTVVEDACADTVPGLHESLMQHVISSTAHVATAAELIEAWKRKKV